ncbi:MAG: hypothetical protein NTV15_00050 [Candidatus Bathyarchaeota archaeon]|nr:hypothetical protein [Candidatus Bathyarchaeota archaeon]
MSLIVKVAERAIETVINSAEPMIAPGPNLISSAPSSFEALPVVGLFIVFSVVVGFGVALWRQLLVRRQLYGIR